MGIASAVSHRDGGLVVICAAIGIQLLLSGVNGYSEYIAWTVLAGGLSLVALAWIRSATAAEVDRRPSRWLDRLLLFPALWLWVPVLNSESVSLATAFVWGWIAALFLALAVLRLPRAEQVRWALVLVVAIAGFYALWRGWEIRDWTRRAQRASEQDVNNLAMRTTLVLLLLPVATEAVICRFPSLRRPMWMVVASIAILGGWVIQQSFGSRAAAILLVTGGILLLLARVRPALALVLGAVVGILVGGASGNELEQYSAVVQPADSMRERLLLFSAAWHLISEAPLLGHGIGSFSELYPALRLPGDLTFGHVVHNDYLQLWAEAGLPMFLWMLAVAAICTQRTVTLGWALVRGSLAPEELQHGRWRFTALLIAGSVLAHALINFPFFSPATVVIFCVAFAIGVGVRAEPEPGRTIAEASDEQSVSGLLRALSSRSLTLLFAGAWLYGAVTAATMVVLADLPVLPGVSRPAWSSQVKYDWAQQADALHLADGLPLATLGTFAAATYRINPEAKAAVGPIALAQYKDAIARSPSVMEYYLETARIMRETGLGDADARIALLERGLRRNPFSARLWWALAWEHVQIGDWSRVAPQQLRVWLDRCDVMVRLDADDVVRFAGLIPEGLLPAGLDLPKACALGTARGLEIGSEAEHEKVDERSNQAQRHDRSQQRQ